MRPDIPLQPQEALSQSRQRFFPSRRRRVTNGSWDNSQPDRDGSPRSLFAAQQSIRTEAPLRICPAALLTRSVLGRLGRMTRNAATQSAFASQRIPRARDARAQRPALSNFRENVSLESRRIARRALNWPERSVAILRLETGARHDK